MHAHLGNHHLRLSLAQVQDAHVHTCKKMHTHMLSAQDGELAPETQPEAQLTMQEENPDLYDFGNKDLFAEKIFATDDDDFDL